MALKQVHRTIWAANPNFSQDARWFVLCKVAQQCDSTCGTTLKAFVGLWKYGPLTFCTRGPAPPVGLAGVLRPDTTDCKHLLNTLRRESRALLAPALTRVAIFAVCTVPALCVWNSRHTSAFYTRKRQAECGGKVRKPAGLLYRPVRWYASMRPSMADVTSMR